MCGARWKTCACVHWEERRLLERAVEIDARGHHPDAEALQRPAADAPELVGGLENPPARTRVLNPRVRSLMQNLRTNHECAHDRWFNRGGPRECEECNDLMPLFIYECRQCHVMACRRCRYHRL
jgi:hypothetical protein